MAPIGEKCGHPHTVARSRSAIAELGQERDALSAEQPLSAAVRLDPEIHP